MCWVADCEICAVPMVVWRHHGTEPPSRTAPTCRASSAGWPTRSSGPGRGPSTPSCARSPTTSTPMPATRAGGCAGVGAAARRRRAMRVCRSSTAAGRLTARVESPPGRRARRLVGCQPTGPRRAPVVVGMARGGVPVASRWPARCGAPLDVVVVRKLGHPRQPELGLGAIGEDGVRIVNDALVRRLGVTEDVIDAVARPRARRARAPPARCTAAGGPRCRWTGRTAIVVDDGLATGFTARAAIEVMRRRGAGRRRPGGPRGPARRGGARCATWPTTWCASRRPSTSSASASGTRTSHQVSDDEVARLLARPPTGRAVIKYLGSKRRLVPVLGELARRARARTALDLFTGTTRVAQAFKAGGAEVTAVDSTRCAAVLAGCYVATDARRRRPRRARAGRGRRSTRCRARRLRDRDVLRAVPVLPARQRGPDRRRARRHRRRATRGRALEPVLLTSLLEAADRVDSTTGVQMAYVKQWADRSFRPLELRVPVLLRGPGPRRARRRLCRGRRARATSTSPISTRPTTSTATRPTTTSGRRWWRGTRPTTTAWRASGPRSATGDRSAFNSRRTMPDALAQVVRDVARPAPRALLQRRVVDRSRRTGRDVPRPGPRRGPRLRLEPLRRRPDRHPQPRRGAGGVGRAAPQPRVRAGGRGAGRGPPRGRARGATSVVTGAPAGESAHCLTPRDRPVNVGWLRCPWRGGRGRSGAGDWPCDAGVAGQRAREPEEGTTWERSTGGWRSSRGPGAASAASTPCCSPPRAPRSS